MRALYVVDEPGDELRVEIVAAEPGVAGRGPNLADPFEHFQDRHVEGSTPEIVDEHDFGFTRGSSRSLVTERSARGFVQQPEHAEPGELAGAQRGPALGVIEIGRHGDDDVVDRLAELRRCRGREGAE